MRTTDLSLAVETARSRGNGIHTVVVNHGPITGKRAYFYVVEGSTTEEIRASRETILAAVAAYFRHEKLLSYSFNEAP